MNRLFNRTIRASPYQTINCVNAVQINTVYPDSMRICLKPAAICYCCCTFRMGESEKKRKKKRFVSARKRSNFTSVVACAKCVRSALNVSVLLANAIRWRHFSKLSERVTYWKDAQYDMTNAARNLLIVSLINKQNVSFFFRTNCRFYLFFYFHIIVVNKSCLFTDKTVFFWNCWNSMHWKLFSWYAAISTNWIRK